MARLQPSRPVVLRGAARSWPASSKWTFRTLAARLLATSVSSASLYSGAPSPPSEQGATPAPLVREVVPYLLGLAEEEESAAAAPSSKPLFEQIYTAGDGSYALRLNVDQRPATPYLSQWSMMDEAPELADDLRVRALWPRTTMVWSHVFLGPRGTVTGLHFDWNNNMFTQLRGTKDWILFPASESDKLSPSLKFDYGATCCDVDLTSPEKMPAAVRARFAEARGWHARLQPGDVLFVPRGVWHAVASNSPSISVAAFGLSVWETLTRGPFMLLLNSLHLLGLYRRGHCTCCRNAHSAYHE